MSNPQTNPFRSESETPPLAEFAESADHAPHDAPGEAGLNESGLRSSSRPNAGRKRSIQRLADHFGRIAATACGGLIVTWAVFNLSLNFLEFRADTSDSNRWWVAVLMAGLTCVLPLLAGFWLLFGSLSESKKS